MKLTPLDVQQQQFRHGFRGYERREVDSFLDLVSGQMGELSRENSEMRAELRRLQRELDEHRDREETLREAMLTAQRAIDEIREQAKKEAQLVVAESEMRAEKILHSAHGRVTKLVDDISELRRQRRRALEEMRGILNTHMKILETYEIQGLGEPEQGGTITILDHVRPPAPPVVGETGCTEASG
ncbi:MAG: DivIVA domain-containing protein [Myxococcota bacterium]